MTSYQQIVTALREAGHLISLPDHPPTNALSGITDDSRRVEPGSLFCAVRGTVSDGHEYLVDASRRGAAAMIVTAPGDVAQPQIVVDDGRLATGIAAAEWYGRPADRLGLIGVTGTNGKSTTALLIRHVLNVGNDVAVIGTLGAFDGHGDALYREGLTTPGVVGLQETLAALVRGGARSVVMEVSSHALDQRRVDGLHFRASVFTNLTHDHLDYHASLDDYRAAKLRLVGYTASDGILVVNGDEPAWRDMPPTSARRVSFGLGANADVRATEVSLGPLGASMSVAFGDTAREVETPLLGAFNVSNALAAAATAWGVGAPVDEIAARLATAPQVPGRMERLVGDPFLVLRDYAHTPDALERAIAAARPLTRRRLLVLFGCGGDRDRKKRSPMGQIAAAGADIAILTSDNPRTEDPDRILDDVAEGMHGSAHLRITDRREAIHRAIGMLDEGDCLLLAGKGHETYQVIGTERVEFDEREIVADVMKGQS